MGYVQNLTDLLNKKADRRQRGWETSQGLIDNFLGRMHETGLEKQRQAGRLGEIGAQGEEARKTLGMEQTNKLAQMEKQAGFDRELLDDQQEGELDALRDQHGYRMAELFADLGSREAQAKADQEFQTRLQDLRLKWESGEGRLDRQNALEVAGIHAGKDNKNRLDQWGGPVGFINKEFFENYLPLNTGIISMGANGEPVYTLDEKALEIFREQVLTQAAAQGLDVTEALDAWIEARKNKPIPLVVGDAGGGVKTPGLDLAKNIRTMSGKLTKEEEAERRAAIKTVQDNISTLEKGLLALSRNDKIQPFEYRTIIQEVLTYKNKDYSKEKYPTVMQAANRVMELLKRYNFTPAGSRLSETK
jgi:hypothetical protein